MTDKEKERLIEAVIQGFDFEKARSIMYLTKKFRADTPSIEDLKEQAKKYLSLALEHQDRELWWAGGLNGFGGLSACYDDKWGLSLNYIAVAKKVRISKD